MDIIHQFESETIADDEGVWVIALEKPLLITQSVAKQISMFYEFGVLKSCNQTMCEMYGFSHPEQLIGARLGDLLPATQSNLEYLSAFIISNYDLHDAESKETDKDGKTIYFLNSLKGIIKDGILVAAKGRQKLLKK